MLLTNPPFKPADLADALTLVTNETWTATHHRGDDTLHDDADSYLVIAAIDRAELYVTIRDRDKRIHIGGSMHYYIPGHHQSIYLTHYISTIDYKPNYDISCGIARGALTIAKDIARRLLPDFRRDRNQAIEKIQQRISDQAQTFAAAQKYMALCGGSATQQGAPDYRETIIHLNTQGVYFSGTMYSPNRMSLRDLSITGEAFITELMQLVAKYTQPKPPERATITHASYSAFVAAKCKGRSDDEAWQDAYSAACDFYSQFFPNGMDEQATKDMSAEAIKNANDAQRIYNANLQAA